MSPQYNAGQLLWPGSLQLGSTPALEAGYFLLCFSTKVAMQLGGDLPYFGQRIEVWETLE